MTPAPKPPPENTERQTFTDTQTAETASFGFAEFEMAVGRMFGLLAGVRLAERFAELGAEVEDNARLTVAQAAILLQREASPTGSFAGPLALRSVEIEAGDQLAQVAPAEALLHPMLQGHVFESFHAKLQDLLSAQHRLPSPEGAITLLEDDMRQCAFVALQLSANPPVRVTAQYGERPTSLMIRMTDVCCPTVIAIALLARGLTAPTQPGDAVHEIKVAMASVRAAAAVLH